MTRSLGSELWGLLWVGWSPVRFMICFVFFILSPFVPPWRFSTVIYLLLHWQLLVMVIFGFLELSLSSLWSGKLPPL